MGLLSACGDANTTEEDDVIDEDQTAQEAEENLYPITLTDATDTEVTIDEKPERIVTMIPSNTEIAFALGLDDEIVGVNDFDDYPEEVEEKERVGGIVDINVEKVISLEPDLVLGESTML